MDAAKMEQVILFFLERINNVHLGSVKLMKLLYYVDFDHFEKYGRPVTGARYRKLPHGPVPDKVDKVIKNMIKKDAVKRVVVNNTRFARNRLIPVNGKFDPSTFTGDEITILEAVACKWADATAAEIEAASHSEAPWATTRDNQAIDYELAHYRSPLPPDEVDATLAASSGFSTFVASLA